MVTRHEINAENSEKFYELMKNLESNNVPLYVLYTGAKNETGQSWCPDCVKAHPSIEEAVKTKMPKNSHFVTVTFEREFWKNPKCSYRHDTRFRLSNLPTFLRWPYFTERLIEEQCTFPDLLEMVILQDRDD